MPTIAAPLRGAIPSPRHALAAAHPLLASPSAPPQFIVVPAHISMWGNDVHGDCVTAEEAFAKACNDPEVFITDQVVIDWATSHSVLEGAYLTQVMTFMQNDGFHEDASVWDDGPYYSVDWTNEATLRTAISTGPVKIGIAADQLSTTWQNAGGKTGWFATAYKADAGEDHCVSLCGYGPMSWLASQLHVAVPAGVNGSAPGYALFTWNSIGIIDEPSLKAITHEAWLRRPTTVEKTTPFPAVSGDPVLIQSRFGTKGNFELVAPAAAGGIDHFWRDNDNPALPWSGATTFGAPLGHVDAVTMIQSDFGTPGNLEVICRVGTKLSALWRDSGPGFVWSAAAPLAIGGAGDPVLIQSRFGTKGNFELVVPATGSGLQHVWRDNDDPALPWSAPTTFAAVLGHVDSVTMIESDFGTPGNLEVICRVGSKLFAIWRDSGPAFAWSDPVQIEAAVAGDPVLIQSRFGTKGNFELVVPAAGGGLEHFWRNNDDPALPWSAPTAFGTSLGHIDGVSMIESDFGTPGNLEVVCRVGSKLYGMWRDSGPAFAWSAPQLLQSEG
jgi:hypothetical protein